MAHQRRHPRTSDTDDLLAALRAPGQSARFRPVLNLSEGGMLIAGTELDVGEIATFEIAGPFFRYAGVAEVGHHTNGASGLRLLSWQGQADRPIRALITKRIRDADLVARYASERNQRVLRRVTGLIGSQRGLEPITPSRRRASRTA